MATSIPNTESENYEVPASNWSNTKGISGFAQSAQAPSPSARPSSMRDARHVPASGVNEMKPVSSNKPMPEVKRMPPTRPVQRPVKQRNKFLIPLLAIILIALVGFMAYKYVYEKVNFVTPIPGKDDSANDGASVPATDGNRWEDPLNGMYFSNEDAAKFKDKKPITVMVNNYVDARPSWGLSQADVVYEAVEEGGITRLMPVFWSRIPEKVMSVRSARYYNAILAAPYYPHFVHWGAAFVPQCQLEGKCDDTNPEVDAYAKIVKIGLPNIDGGNYACQDDGPDCVFGRDTKRIAEGRAIEHTSYVALQKIYDKAKEIRAEESWQKNIPPKYAWKFKDDADSADRGDIGGATPITYNYWDSMTGFNVKWEYDKDKNEYVRWQGGAKAMDGATNQELRAKTVVIRFTKETPVGDHKHHLYQEIVGTGDALIFEDGKVIQAKWTRPDEETLDKYTDSSGNEVQFVRGQIWVQLVQIGNKINYESKPAATPSPSPTKN